MMNRHLKTLLFCFFVIGINAGNSYAVFRLNVESLEGEDAIDFGRLKAMEDGGTPIPVTESKRVRLNVTTDLNQPYIVSQMVDREPEGRSDAVVGFSCFCDAEPGIRDKPYAESDSVVDRRNANLFVGLCR